MERRQSEYDQERISEQFRKLFIGGLTPNTSEEKLRKYYQQWGELVDAVVMKDCNSGRSRGFGFVTYKEVFMVDEAQNNRPHEIDGKIVEAKRAMPREDSIHPEAHMTVTKLFVGGLKKEIVNQELVDYFTDYGIVIECEIVSWKDTGKSRGFGFVLFDDYDPVDKAILYKPHFIQSSKIDVKKALSKEEIFEIKRKKQSSHLQRLSMHEEDLSTRYFNIYDPYYSNKCISASSAYSYGYMNKYLEDEALDPSYYTGGYNSSGIFPKSKGCPSFYSPLVGFYNHPNFTMNFWNHCHNYHCGATFLSSIARHVDWKPTPLASYSNNCFKSKTEFDRGKSCDDPQISNFDRDICDDDDFEIIEN